MGAPVFSVADFLSAAQNLLPRGRAWTRESLAKFTSVLTAIANVASELSGRASQLLTDAFPASTLELLPEWEASLGLPDPCAGESPTVIERRNQVVARFAVAGGQSAPYFIALALALGYAITITEFAPFRCGVSHCGEPLCGVDWWFVWQVNAPTRSISYFSCGVSECGEPLSDFGNTVLECELTAFKPAHTVVLFSYS